MPLRISIKLTMWGAVADRGGGVKGAMPPPRPVKIGQKKRAAAHGDLYFMFLAPPPLSEVSGSATGVQCPGINCRSRKRESDIAVISVVTSVAACMPGKKSCFLKLKK